jgi:hypothetical protein
MRVTTPIGLTLDLLPDWFDVTDDLSGEGIPFTLGRTQGSGALQFSVGLYRSGQVPNPSPEDLRRLLLDFSSTRELGESSDVQTEAAPIRLAAATFRSDFFVRVWYISDGRSVARVTLTCGLDPDPEEIADCEHMLRSVHFESTSPA